MATRYKIATQDRAETLTNKTMTGATNTLTASLLKSASTEVSVSAATAPSSGQVLTATSSTTATWQTPSGGSLSWGATANGATGTGLALSMDNSYAASGIGQSITIGNTQANALTGLKIDTGTAAVDHKAVEIIHKGGEAGTFSYGAVSINSFESATQAVSGKFPVGYRYGDNFNTNSSAYSTGLRIRNEQNAGSGVNTGIYVKNYSTEVTIGNELSGSGLYIEQAGVDGTAQCVYGGSNINASTNGLINCTIGNTQSGATVLNKANSGSSAQAHINYLATGSNGSTTAAMFKAACLSGYTGVPFLVDQDNITSTNFRKIMGEANTGITIWISNGTTANGNLSGTAGDICLNAGSNKPEYCTGTTNWTALV